MTDDGFLFGAAIGVGVGYLNANVLAVPAWVNILAMFLFASAAMLERL